MSCSRLQLCVVWGLLSSCTNLSTLQTAAPLAPDATEVSAQGWGVLDTSSGRTGVLPAVAWRHGVDWGDLGVRLTYPGNTQLDAKASLLDGRFALSLGFGLGADIGSLLVAGLTADDDPNTTSDDDNTATPFTFDAFVPFIASYYVVPEYLSVHGTLRPQVWLVSFEEDDTASQLFLTSAVGVRAGKDFGVHVEAAPIWGTFAGFNWTGAAALFVRFGAPSGKPPAE